MSGTLWYCPACGMVDSKDVGYANDHFRNFHYHVHCDTRVSRLAPEFIVVMRERIALLEARLAGAEASIEHKVGEISDLDADNQRLRDALAEIGDVCYSISKTRAIIKAALLQEDKPHE